MRRKKVEYPGSARRPDVEAILALGWHDVHEAKGEMATAHEVHDRVFLMNKKLMHSLEVPC